MENTLESGIAGVACTIIVKGWLWYEQPEWHEHKESYCGSTAGLHARAKALKEDMEAEGFEDVQAFWQPQGWVEDKIPMIIFPE
jgi:hypothetical protein